MSYYITTEVEPDLKRKYMGFPVRRGEGMKSLEYIKQWKSKTN